MAAERTVEYGWFESLASDAKGLRLLAGMDDGTLAGLMRRAMEERLVEDARRRAEGGKAPAQPVPAAKLSDSSGFLRLYGHNELSHPIWFDGRFLTAGALQREHDHLDARARLLAGVHPSGVAWGLGVGLADGAGDEGRARFRAAHALRRDGGGLRDAEHVLEPGLAFDDAGAPILVGGPFRFRLADLLARYRQRPREVAAGDTRFTACVCLRPSDGGGGGGAAVASGTFLLVIEAIEEPEGDASVYGEVCSSSRPIHCRADRLRGGFALSLARVPVSVPASAFDDAMAQRGILSAWYFDVFEHSLVRRWDPDFARDGRFCAGNGPAPSGCTAVPLAMVHVAVGGEVRFLDPWIPRRTIVATRAATGAELTLGAPSPAARVARLHQFQCMLAESLEVEPLHRTAVVAGEPVHKPVAATMTGPVRVAGGDEAIELRTSVEQGTDVLDDPDARAAVEAATYIVDRILPQALPGIVQAEFRAYDPTTVPPTLTLVTKAGTWKTVGADQSLEKSDRVRAMIELPGEPTPRTTSSNLYERGFRHIPPAGFLPIDPALFDGRLLDQLAQAGPAATPLLAARLAREAAAQASLYFRRTNVRPYFLVAPHDDDLLEDLQDAERKDPIALAPLQARIREVLRRTEGIELAHAEFVKTRVALKASSKEHGLFGLLLDVFAKLWTRGGNTLDDLANRTLCLVKVLIPLQGLARKHPLLGVVPEDSASLVAEWEAAGLPARPFGRAGDERDAPFVARALPRHFALYAVQRVAVLDAFAEVLDGVAHLEKNFESLHLSLAAPAARAARPSAAELFDAVRAIPDKQKLAAAALMSDPDIRLHFAGAIVENGGKHLRTEHFDRLIDTWKLEGGGVTDPPKEALDQLDAVVAHVPELEPLLWLAAIGGRETFTELLEEGARITRVAPARDERGRILAGSAREALLRPGGRLTVLDSAADRRTVAHVEHAVFALRPSALGIDVAGDPKLSDLMAGTPESVAERVGTKTKARELEKAVKALYDAASQAELLATVAEIAGREEERTALDAALRAGPAEGETPDAALRRIETELAEEHAVASAGLRRLRETLAGTALTPVGLLALGRVLVRDDPTGGARR